MKHKLYIKGLQRLGKAIMTPLSLLPIAGILMAIGMQFDNKILEQAGRIVFDNLPILFAMGIAVGLSNDGIAGIGAAMGFLIMNKTISLLLNITQDMMDNPSYTMVLGIPTLQIGIFGGLLVGLLTYVCYQKFAEVRLPDFLSFFSGKRLVLILTTTFSLLLGLILPYIWMPIQYWISCLSNIVSTSGSLFASFIYGLIERALIPFGLQHIWNFPFYYSFGEYLTKAGQLVTGDIPIFFSQISDGAVLTAGKFMTGRFPIMMFGLPAASFAMIKEARPENRKQVRGFLLPAALTSFFAGITEPLEFSFLFVAPILYVIHCILCAISFLLMTILDVHIGHPFTGGAIDFFLYGVMPNRTPWWIVIVVGIGFAVLYYFLFRFMIRKFDLKTPGRDSKQIELTVDKRLNTRENRVRRAEAVIKALGGISNIQMVDSCMSRLRVTLLDESNIKEDILKEQGASSVVRVGKGDIQAIFGSLAPLIADDIRDIIKKSELEQFIIENK
ncbi:PTS transporter subunit EIIC [Anaerorhabdus sp.]|uniref:PTS transporter subunit EIIC n=1 Tax=Anaerorhabdus sp. TaxID=1872524 RepID=UPI002FCA9CFE